MAAIDRPAVQRTARWTFAAALGVFLVAALFMIRLAWVDYARFRALESSFGVLVALAAALCAACTAVVSAARRPAPDRIRAFGETLGIHFAPSRRWSTAFTSRYRGLPLTWLPVFDEPDRVVVGLPRALNLGLYCGFRTSPRGQDLFGRNVALGRQDLVCLASDEPKARALFERDARVGAAPAALEPMGYKFLVSDTALALLADEPPPRLVVDAACELSLALGATAFRNDRPPRPPLRRRGWFRILLVIVAPIAFIALVAVVVGLAIALWGR